MKCARAGCKAWAIKGGTVCRVHGGKAKQVRRAAAVRAELIDWGLNDEKVDPGETLLRLLSQSARRAALYANLLEQQYDGTSDMGAQFAGSGLAALVGFKYDLTKEGDPVAVEEAVRGLAQLEAAERDRCAKFAKLALDAGIAERQVRLAERQGALVADVIGRILDSLELSVEQRALVPSVVPRELRALAG